MDYHDMLARLGEGSAHPGGFLATLKLLESLSLPVDSHILEIGCGTGRTACYLAKRGYQVTAIDLNRQMLDKAVRRARRERVDVRFVQADVASLPFPENHFDMVFVESVTIFTPWRSALTEYRRVLKPAGLLVDRGDGSIRPKDRIDVSPVKAILRYTNSGNGHSMEKTPQAVWFHQGRGQGTFAIHGKMGR
ncbi:methyltransferase domain-containing protein [Paenibacillus amylolyticus]|nr:methyltransferase domain-containing protein [Paenibacillus amylolyticus]